MAQFIRKPFTFFGVVVRTTARKHIFPALARLHSRYRAIVRIDRLLALNQSIVEVPGEHPSNIISNHLVLIHCDDYGHSCPLEELPNHL